MLSFSFPPWYPGVMTTIISPGYLFYFVLLMGLCLYGFKRFKQLDQGYRYLTYLAVTITVSESLSRLAVWQFENNLPLYHILIPFQAVFYYLIFRSLIRNPKAKKVALFLGLLTLLTSLGLSFQYGLNTFPSLNLSVLSLYIIGFSLHLFYQLVQNPSEQSLFRLPDFWFALGNLIFFAGAFMIFTLLQILIINDLNRPQYIYDVILVLNYFLYTSYVVSIYFGTRKLEVINGQYS